MVASNHLHKVLMTLGSVCDRMLNEKYQDITLIQKNLYTSTFIAAQFTIAKCWKQPKCPSVNEWIRKLWSIYTREYYTADRKKQLLPFTTAWMELESIMLSEEARL